MARFGDRCHGCRLRERCTDAASSRNVTAHRHEALLPAQRARAADPDLAADYRATRPKVERKLAHLVRRSRRARRHRLDRVDAGWNLLAGAGNLARLATTSEHGPPPPHDPHWVLRLPAPCSSRPAPALPALTWPILPATTQTATSQAASAEAPTAIPVSSTC